MHGQDECSLLPVSFCAHAQGGHGCARVAIFSQACATIPSTYSSARNSETAINMLVAGGSVCTRAALWQQGVVVEQAKSQT